MKIFSMLQLLILTTVAIQCFLIPTVYANTSANISKYFGQYEIHDIRNVGGSITPDRVANQWLGSFVEIQPNKFSIRNVEIANPRYEFESIRIKKEEGNVVSRELSLFWGIGTSRAVINRILVFEDPLVRHPYEKIEVIDKNNLLELYDGRIYFFRRVTDRRMPQRGK